MTDDIVAITAVTVEMTNLSMVNCSSFGSAVLVNAVNPAMFAFIYVSILLLF